jgi:hypothetical protein
MQYSRNNISVIMRQCITAILNSYLEDLRGFPRSHLGANFLTVDESLCHSHGLDLVDGRILDPWFGDQRLRVISASHHSHNHLFTESSKIFTAGNWKLFYNKKKSLIPTVFTFTLKPLL